MTCVTVDANIFGATDLKIGEDETWGFVDNINGDIALTILAGMGREVKIPPARYIPDFGK